MSFPKRFVGDRILHFHKSEPFDQHRWMGFAFERFV